MCTYTACMYVYPILREGKLPELDPTKNPGSSRRRAQQPASASPSATSNRTSPANQPVAVAGNPRSRSPRADAEATTSPRERGRFDSRMTALASLAIVVVIAIGLFIWAFRLEGELHDTRHDLAAVTTERDTLRQNANATAYTLTPTSSAPANATGRAFLTIQGSGVLTTANLPRLGTNQIYQVWFRASASTSPIPGGTFALDKNGNGFLLLSGDVGSFQTLSVSVEPASGSTAPTTPMLLTVDVSGVRG
ncbi:MAG TPA: anti-sigma factor [Thermomicrobiales bacterium]|nr:anti-sigma factor [Thermomicrobiales bacterium]